MYLYTNTEKEDLRLILKKRGNLAKRKKTLNESKNGLKQNEGKKTKNFKKNPFEGNTAKKTSSN